jgi:hypothetical protein
VASRARAEIQEWRATMRQMDRYVDTFWIVAVVGVTSGTAIMATQLSIGPRIPAFYDAVATVAAAALIAVAIDNRNIAPFTLSSPRQSAGLLLGLSFGLLLTIVGSLIAIGIGHGTPLLFGITIGPGGFAILMLLLAVTLRAADYGLESDRRSDGSG